MDAKIFSEIVGILDARAKAIGLAGINDWSPGGKVMAARKLALDAEDFCREVVARAKAMHEQEAGHYEQLIKDYGPGFDEIEPNYRTT